ALNYAVDKEALLATVFKGIALKAFAPLTAAMLDDPTLRQAYPFDPAKAQALLAEAGWQPGADGIRTRAGARLEIVLNAIEYGGGPEPMAIDEALTVPLLDELSVWAFRAAVRGVKYNFATYPVLSDAAIQK